MPSGVAGWDNWMIYHAVSSPWYAIDASPSLEVIHQQHDYAHLEGGQAHYRAKESAVNTDLAGGMRQLYSLLDIPDEFRKRRIPAQKDESRSFPPFSRTPPAAGGTHWLWLALGPPAPLAKMAPQCHRS